MHSWSPFVCVADFVASPRPVVQATPRNRCPFIDAVLVCSLLFHFAFCFLVVSMSVCFSVCSTINNNAERGCSNFAGDRVFLWQRNGATRMLWHQTTRCKLPPTLPSLRARSILGVCECSVYSLVLLFCAFLQLHNRACCGGSSLSRSVLLSCRFVSRNDLVWPLLCCCTW